MLAASFPTNVLLYSPNHKIAFLAPLPMGASVLYLNVLTQRKFVAEYICRENVSFIRKTAKYGAF